MGTGKSLFIIFIAALVVRLLFLLSPVETGDSDEYRTYGENLVNYHIFSFSENNPKVPSTFRTPVYPFFIAVFYWLFGINDMPVFIVQCIISALTCLLVYFIALDLFDKRIAFGSGLICALHPFLSWTATTLMTETLFTFIFTGAVLLFVKAFRYQRALLFFIGGILLGAATLTKPTSQFFFVYVLVFLLLLNPRKVFLKNAFVFLLGFVILLIPWGIRNYRVTGEFIPISSGGKGVNLYLATVNENVYDDVKQQECHITAQKDPLYAEYLMGLSSGRVIYVEKKMWRAALVNIKNNPVSYILRRLRNHPFLWIGSSYLVRLSNSSLFKIGSFGLLILKFVIIFFLHLLPIVVFLLTGLFLRSQWKRFAFVYFVPFYFSFVHLPIHIETRYSIPAFPFILIFCFFGLCQIFHKHNNMKECY
ncbi:MAG: glycosyltransferase family 39 protein [Candidatus Omnitrophica bacterium]|nr:glycosyltransferase family 39 protein [Candidatus Omnitrophota bacterium]